MTDLQPIKDRAKKAEDEMDRLTAGSPGTNWRWSIPANPEKDSDLILSASAADVRKLLPAVEAVLALHHPFEWSFGQGPVLSCQECADGMAGVEAEYPCATVRAIDKALG